ncbi:MAG: homocysteine S-methyltransferase family protein [Chitinispirillaceae bacterium]|nr:homocysteine S-methyltransferase family protein [Chitinispirillaceae bacterium]
MTCLFRTFLSERVPVVFDGALGTQIQNAGLQSDDFDGNDGCIEVLNLTRPGIIKKIHTEYIAAGANVIETNTFGANRAKLQDKGLASRCVEINREGARLAREAADAHGAGGKRVCVCGTLGPTGFLPSSKEKGLQGGSFDDIAALFEEQAGALLDGGVDLFLIETAQDLLEVRAALFGINRLKRQRASDVPVQVQVTLDTTGRMLLGSDLRAFLGAVTALEIDAVGLNCGTGPAEMRPFIEQLLALTGLPVSMIPNAGIPENAGGRAVYSMEPSAFADIMAPLVLTKGLQIIGGCCGTTPAHIRELVSRVKGRTVVSRAGSRLSCFCATGISGIDLESAARPVIIGERLNAQGSRKTKELLLARNWEELGDLALKQARRNCHLLDLCVATNERDDEADSMKTLLSYLSDRVVTPFSIDTTELRVFDRALRVSPGSALLNSINLERGSERARNVLALARDFGCPVIALTIDDHGMARTVERKVGLARALRDLACGEYGLPEHFLYIDPLVFTLATGDEENADAAATSLRALGVIKQEMPGLRTVMGVSNVSFGFSPPARRVLNNLLLYHAVKHGLDAAIFNPLHLDDVGTYDPAVRRLGEDLLYNRSPDALASFIHHFEETSPDKKEKQRKKAQPVERLSADQQLYRAIIDRDRRHVPGAIKRLLTTHDARAIIDSILLPAMADVGERMSAGTMILPFVLQAAEVMREAITILEPLLKDVLLESKGKILLATVFGDVHDIGKNLVGTILRNQGFEVVDLGKQVELQTIMRAVEEEKPDVVGLSALLVTTSREMAACVREFARRGFTLPVLIGGAAVNRDFASRIEVLEDGTRYKGGVYYGKDAFEAARVIESIKKSVPLPSIPVRPKVTFVHDHAQASNEAPEPLEYGPPLVPPFYGTGSVFTWDTGTLLEGIDSRRLFKTWWGGGKLDTAAFEKAMQDDFLPAFNTLCDSIKIEKLLGDAGALYGYFPVITDNELIIILDPSDMRTELMSFRFPRVAKKANRSITDFLRPEGDLIAVQVVTAGRAISKKISDYLVRKNNYTSGYYLNGIAISLTEDLADRTTNEIRRGLGLSLDTGRRYSFGYGGLPPIDEQKKLFELCAIEERLGITLTEGFQMVPEHSTLGIYIHHEKAEYLG